MDHVTCLECTRCGAEYDSEQMRYTCPEHEGYTGILEVKYDYDLIDDRFDADLDGNISSQWKYKPFLPVEDDAEPVTLDEGGTPLLDAPTLSERLGVKMLVKDDTRNPTASFKDRATTVSVTKAKHQGFNTVTCASTGNAAASLSGYAARAGLECRIFVPGDVPVGKLSQHLIYGADVLPVNGSYDDACDLSLEVTEEYGWYNRTAAINPFQIEGKRTVGHELAEQSVVRGEVPDWFVFSMGDGCTIAGAWKGFKEFYDLGYVDSYPKMLGVQAEGASGIHDAFHGQTSEEKIPDTLAGGISVGRPRNTGKVIRALEESGGTSVLVSDESILASESLLAESEGLFAEPAAAATVAGVKTARQEGIIGSDETVVVDSTGFGLKDTESAKEAAGDVSRIDPTLSEVQKLYGAD